VNRQHIPLSIIQVTTADWKIPNFNRFFLPQIYTDYGKPLNSLLKSARCNTSALKEARKVLPNVQSPPGRKRFVLVHYEHEGITPEEVLRSFKDACIRPATLEDMLALTSQYLASRGDTTVIALGSSNIRFPELSHESRNRLYRLFITRKMHARWQKNVEVFPLMDWGNTYSHLRLTKGVGGWKSGVTFLGVVEDREFDIRLVDLKISTAEYLALPKWDRYPDIEHAPLGTRYVTESGYICRVVKGSEMFIKQRDPGMPTPKIGLRYYRPVFTDI
jgi:hypothetical protein